MLIWMRSVFMEPPLHTATWLWLSAMCTGVLLGKGFVAACPRWPPVRGEPSSLLTVGCGRVCAVLGLPGPLERSGYLCRVVLQW